MVKSSGALVKTMGMLGIRKVEELKIEVMAIFMN